MAMTYAELLQYKENADLKIQSLEKQIEELQDVMNTYTHLLDISAYINQYVKSQDFFTILADVFLGVFGAQYVTIYMCDDFGEYHLATQQKTPQVISEQEKQFILQYSDAFIIDRDKPLYKTILPDYIVYSCMGVPIMCDDRKLGYILVHHTRKHHFTKEHKNFLRAVANYVGVALENNLIYTSITEKANKDPLTGLYNRRYFFDNVSKNTAKPYAIVMADIDNFKVVNDTYGHPYGDVVLQVISKIIKQHTSEDDIVARYGGEEIIMCLYDIQDKAQLMDKLEMIRTIIAYTTITSKDISQTVTLSFGAYLNMQQLSIGECVNYADKNLYISKATGKNKCTIS